MYNSLTLIPAYGRDYKSKAQVLADYNNDKDFMVCDYLGKSAYINKSDLEKIEGITHLHFRYQRLTKVLVLKL